MANIYNTMRNIVSGFVSTDITGIIAEYFDTTPLIATIMQSLNDRFHDVPANAVVLTDDTRDLMIRAHDNGALRFLVVGDLYRLTKALSTITQFQDRFLDAVKQLGPHLDNLVTGHSLSNNMHFRNSIVQIVDSDRMGGLSGIGIRTIDELRKHVQRIVYQFHDEMKVTMCRINLEARDALMSMNIVRDRALQTRLELVVDMGFADLVTVDCIITDANAGVPILSGIMDIMDIV